MEKEFHVKCAKCGHRVAYVTPIAGCEQCGHDWLDADYNLDALAKTWQPNLASRPFNTMWRYWELLPLQKQDNIISMGEGGTPLLKATNLGLMLGHRHLYLKDERQGPTSSFKDRQASLAISAMKEAGVTEAVVASTGNVAISYSAYCARAGIKLWAFLTSTVPADKMRETAFYGTEVIKVTSTYDRTKIVAANFAGHKRLFVDRGVRSIAAKESMKTIAFEIAEQLGQMISEDDTGPSRAFDGPAIHPLGGGQARTAGRTSRWCVPDWYVQAVSGGLGPVGVWKGFRELYQMGFTKKMPKLALIQAAGCAPMVNSFKADLEEAEDVTDPQTRITTLATGSPGAVYPFLRNIMLEHGGVMEAVTDEEAFRAMRVMAKMDGLSMEPAAALACAGVFKLLGQQIIKPDEVVVINISGHTFPVEKHLLGDDWARTLGTAEAAALASHSPAPREGLMTALNRLDGRVKRVVIVEDEPDAARLLRRILQACGKYQIFEAQDGSTGLDLIRRERPDLILLDLMMPELDGFTLLEIVKSEEEFRDVPVIVVTAKELTSAERRRLDGQVESLLQKGSFTEEDLLGDILEALE
ncbi:MAG: pyridoxal-phosphate dependent enzyme [Anaerolineales bacterium]|nr:MAG: pyridoxal-phosphate dependent enzyme [Anaerolineales bacterium]